MTSRQADKKQSYKPKFQQKAEPISKFGFVFDEENVDYRTQIPDLPAKPIPKPNQEAHNKKIQQIRSKIQNLKQQRKAKKQQYKKGSQNFQQEISTFKSNIELGKKCIVVLNHDLQSIQKSQAQVEEKIQKKIKLLKNLQRGPRQPKQQKKKHEQMTYQQLEAEEERLSSRVTTASLSKKQETQINTLIAKLVRLKANASHGQKPKDNTQQIQITQQSLQRLKRIKQNLHSEYIDVKHKLSCIQQKIEQFKDEIEELQQQKKNQQNETLYEQAKKLKNQIYQLRQQQSNLLKQFQKKKTQYQYQQAKIQWIKWAAQVKKRKNQEWQAQREERRRQRLREKNKNQAGKADKKNQEVKQAQLKPQRKKFNKNQKQIDNCTFLISYCQGLIQKKEPEKKQQNVSVGDQKRIDDLLKTGQWAKVKGVQVIKSKKNRDDEQIVQKPKKKKPAKVKQQQTTQQQKPISFNHQFFIQHYFDSVRLVPPTTAEQLQPILKQLNEKLNYYLQNPDIRQQRPRQEQRQQKPKYTAEKFAKVKNNPRQKKINTQDFPHLN